jgi:hypothetical protein
VKTGAWELAKRAIESKGWVPAWSCAGLVARLVLVVAAGGAPRFYDERDYDQIAEALRAGQGFASLAGPTAFRAPGQPLFLALVYSLSGHRPLVAELVQALLLVPLPFVAARLARLISRHRLVPPLAAALVAVHPALAYASASLYPVTLTALTLMLGVWLVASALEAGGRARAVLGALLLGVAGAFATYLAPLALAAAAAALARKRFGLALTMALVGLAPAGLWAARNAAVMGSAQLSTNGGFNLALGANDRATPLSGNWIEPDLSRAEVPDDEVARDRAYRADAARWIHAHPARYAALAAGRALAALDSVGKPRTAGAHESRGAALIGWALAPCIALALLGLWRARRSPVAWLSAAALALVMLSSAATIAKPRFRFPCDPLLFVFTAAALVEIGERRRARSGAPRLATS